MTVRIRLFAQLREVAGAEWVELDLPAGSNAAQLRGEVARRWPQVASLVARSLVSVDASLAADSTPLDAAAEIALIPPVSGG